MKWQMAGCGGSDLLAVRVGLFGGDPSGQLGKVPNLGVLSTLHLPRLS